MSSLAPPVEMTQSPDTATEEVFFAENRRGQQLFMWMHAAANPSPTTGVVFCHPLGEEKQCSYRPYVKFARSLAQRGIPSLRFDAFGFGDSEGDLVEATIETQVEDTLDAIDQLREASDVKAICLVGARLGASVAALAARRHPSVTALVLASPIQLGGSYWDGLVGTSRMAALAMGQKPKSRGEMEADLAESGYLEISGQLIGAEFARQLQMLDLWETLRDWNGRLFMAGLKRDRAEIDSLTALSESLTGLAEPVKLAACDRDFWSHRCMYDLYTPTELIEQVGSWIASEQ